MRYLLILVAAGFLMGFEGCEPSAPAAVTPCKGLDQVGCAVVAECAWEGKDGAAGHCAKK